MFGDPNARLLEDKETLSTGESSGQGEFPEVKRTFMETLTFKDKSLSSKAQRNFLIWELVSSSQVDDYKDNFHFDEEGLFILSAYLYFIVGHGVT
jgi:hypothetical protein